MSDYIKKGIDISYCQTKVDWNKVDAEFVIMRAGYGKYTSQKDTMFESHYSNAKAKGIPCGAYWYSYCMDVEGAKAEAKACLEVIKGKQFEYPIFFDLEESSQLALGKEKVSAMIKAFLETVEAAGYWVGLYGSYSSLTNCTDDYIKTRYSIWLAHWGVQKSPYKGDYGVWQYKVGKANGITGDCDLDYCYVDYPTKIKEKGLNGFSSNPTPTPEPTPQPEPKPDNPTTVTFTPRLKKPEKGNKYYNTTSVGGYAVGCILGKPTQDGLNVLSNCVPYAAGRFNEIGEYGCWKYLKTPPNAENFIERAKSEGLTVSKEPSLGAIIVWQKGATLSGSDGAGHVAVVEQINADGSIVTSESGYNCSNPFWTQKRTKGNGNWGQNTAYTFLGFIENPAVKKQAEPDNKAPYPVPTRSLREGDTGEDVLWLQYYLMMLQHYNDELDGRFDTYTLGGLLAWQLHNGLEVDGVCGPATRNSLLNAL